MAEPSANLPESFPLNVLVEESTLRRLVSSHIVNTELRTLIDNQLSTLSQVYVKAFRDLESDNANLKNKVSELQKENAFLQTKLDRSQPQSDALSTEINMTQSEQSIPKARKIVRRSMPVKKMSMSPPPSKYDQRRSVQPAFTCVDSYGVHEHDLLTEDILKMLSPVSTPSILVSPVETRRSSMNGYFEEFGVENAIAISSAELHQDCRGLERNGSGASNATISSTASSDYSNTTSTSTAHSDMSESEKTPSPIISTKHHGSIQADLQTFNDSPRGRSQFRTSLDEPSAPTTLKNLGSAHVPRPYSVAEFGLLSSANETKLTEFSGASILLSDGVMASDLRFRRTETLQYGGESSLWSAMVNPASDEDTCIKIITAFLRNNGHPNIAKPTPNQDVLLYGYGLLHIAIITRAVKFLEFLLQAGANPDAISLCTMDEDKMSPIFLAAKINFVDGIRLLVKYGGSIKNALGHSVRKKTAFIGAAETGAADALRLLIRYSGTMGWTNIPDAMGVSALHWACWFNQIECVRILITEGNVMPEMSDKEGETPLHYAAKRGYIDIVTALVQEYHTNVNVIVTKKKGTPLDVAPRKSDKKVEKILRSLGGLTQKEVQKKWSGDYRHCI